MIKEKKNERRKRRKLSIRNRIFGTNTRPRISFFKSNTSLYAQVIDDENGLTICSVKSLKSKNREKATELGIELAKVMKANKIEKAVFDRNGYKYHGVVKAFVDGLREIGIGI